MGESGERRCQCNKYHRRTIEKLSFWVQEKKGKAVAEAEFGAELVQSRVRVYCLHIQVPAT